MRCVINTYLQKTVVIRPDDKPFMNSSIRRRFEREIAFIIELSLPTTQIIGHNIDIGEMT